MLFPIIKEVGDTEQPCAQELHWPLHGISVSFYGLSNLHRPMSGGLAQFCGEGAGISPVESSHWSTFGLYG